MRTNIPKRVPGKVVGGVYCGLDLSLTGSGIVILDPLARVLYNATLKSNLKGMERLDFIRRSILEAFQNFSINSICIQGYSMGSHSGQAFSIGELGGLIKWTLYKRLPGTPIHLIPPTRLKKFIVGGGKAEKDMIMMIVLKRWGYESKDNNQADAYGLARLAMCLGGVSMELNKAQNEIIRDIRAGK